MGELKRFAIVYTSLIIFGILFCGCVSSDEEKGQLVILKHHSYKDKYTNWLTVEGTAKNVGNKRLSYAEVVVKFYDAQGNLVGDWIDNTNNLEPGETWRFKVSSLDDNAVSYKIYVGDCWS